MAGGNAEGLIVSDSQQAGRARNVVEVGRGGQPLVQAVLRWQCMNCACDSSTTIAGLAHSGGARAVVG